jgi:hypothetical protein
MTTQVVSRLLQEFHLSVGMDTVFDHPTVSELAEFVSSQLSGESTTCEQSLSIPRRNPLNDCPLSFAQQRLWFLDQLEPGSAAYNVSIAFRLKGQLRIDGLQRAVLELRILPPRKTERLSVNRRSQRQYPDHRQQPANPSLPHA